MTATELIKDLKNRGFRICERVDSGVYLNPIEWSPLTDRQAIQVTRYVMQMFDVMQMFERRDAMPRKRRRKTRK